MPVLGAAMGAPTLLLGLPTDALFYSARDYYLLQMDSVFSSCKRADRALAASRATVIAPYLEFRSSTNCLGITDLPSILTHMGDVQVPSSR